MNANYRTMKSMEFFVRGLTPASHKQKAHQFLIEYPGTTWQQLEDYVSNKNLSNSMSSEFTGTSSNSTDNKLEIDEIKNQLKELNSLLKDKN